MDQTDRSFRLPGIRLLHGPCSMEPQTPIADKFAVRRGCAGGIRLHLPVRVQYSTMRMSSLSTPLRKQ